MKEKFLSILLVGVMIFSPATVFAVKPGPSYTTYEDSEGDVDYNEVYDYNTKNKQNCEVEVSLSSEFSVIIPKKIVLDGATNTSQNYEVKVKADIDGEDYIDIIPVPDDNYGSYLKQAGKDDVPYTVTQPIQRVQIWNGEGDGVVSNNRIAYKAETLSSNYKSLNGDKSYSGTVTVEGLSAGKWESVFNFQIKLGHYWPVV